MWPVSVSKPSTSSITRGGEPRKNVQWTFFLGERTAMDGWAGGQKELVVSPGKAVRAPLNGCDVSKCPVDILLAQ